MGYQHRAPEVRFGYVVSYYQTMRPELVEAATREFIDLVDPDPKLNYETRVRLNELANEWFIFDFVMENGLTPLQEYTRINPESRGGMIIKRLKEAEKTQFASDFWLTDVDVASSYLVVEPFLQDAEYRILDYLASQQLSEQRGDIKLRVAKVEDEWILAGNVIGFVPIVPTQRMKDMIREEGSGEASSRPFIELVKACYSKPSEDQEAEGLGGIVGQLGDDPTQIIEEAQVQLQSLAERGRKVPSWETIAEIVYNENGEDSPIDILQSLFDTSELESEDELNLTVTVFFSAWNALPHKALGDKSPIEMRMEAQGDNDSA